MFSKMGISLKYFVKEYLSLHVVVNSKVKIFFYTVRSILDHFSRMRRWKRRV